MKIKFILSTVLTALILLLISCDDDLNPVGSSIRPGNDNMFLGVDTFDITAKTIKWDSIYAKTNIGLLGEYEESIFGKTKSDYLCEFFCDKETNFKDKVVTIDSVTVDVYIKSYIGDSISPVGLSAYRIDQALERHFYTNIDPTDYCDMTTVLGRNLFSLSKIKTTNGLKRISINVDTVVGREIHDKWKDDPASLHDPASFKKFFPGVYITQTFGTGVLMTAEYTMLNINYSYVGRNYDDTKDSIRTTYLQLANTPEVIQMNRVESSNIDELLLEGNPKRTYMKTPAGVYTELTIPLNKIADVVKQDTTVNSAKIVLKGLTEEEQYSKFERPTNLLFIHKDSVNAFFKEKKLPDNTTSFIVPYYKSTNSYNFNNIAQYSNMASGYIPKMINYYLEKFRKENYAVIPDLKYVLIPVNVSTSSSSSYYGTTTSLTGISNLMSPTSAIIRADESNLKMPVVFSKYNER